MKPAKMTLNFGFFGSLLMASALCLIAGAPAMAGKASSGNSFVQSAGDETREEYETRWMLHQVLETLADRSQRDRASADAMLRIRKGLDQIEENGSGHLAQFLHEFSREQRIILPMPNSTLNTADLQEIVDNTLLNSNNECEHNRAVKITGNRVSILSNKDGKKVAVFKEKGSLGAATRIANKDQMIFELAHVAGFGELVTPTVNLDVGSGRSVVGKQISFLPAPSQGISVDNDPLLLERVRGIFRKATNSERNFTNLGDLNEIITHPDSYHLTADEAEVLQRVVHAIDQKNLEKMVVMAFLMGVGDFNSGSLVLKINSKGKIITKFVDFEAWLEQGRADPIPGLFRQMLPQLHKTFSEDTVRLVENLDHDRLKSVLLKYGISADDIQHFEARLAMLKRNSHRLTSASLIEASDGMQESYKMRYFADYRKSKQADAE